MLLLVVSCAQKYIVVSENALYHLRSRKVVTFPVDSTSHFYDVVTLSEKEFEKSIEEMEELPR